MPDYDMAESSRRRFWSTRDKVAAKLHEIANDVQRIEEHDSRGKQRELAAVLGQTLHVVLWGVANLPLQQMASWAESAYEIERYDAAQEVPAGNPTGLRILCGYTIDDPETVCVLTKGHTLPYDGGILHLSGAGVQFA